MSLYTRESGLVKGLLYFTLVQLNYPGHKIPGIIEPNKHCFPGDVIFSKFDSLLTRESGRVDVADCVSDSHLNSLYSQFHHNANLVHAFNNLEV